MERHDYRITSDYDAEQAVKAIKALDAEQDRLLLIVLKERVELDTKEAQIKSDHDDKVAYYKSLLREYMETVETKETKTQRIYQLLSGKLITKKPTVRVRRDDEVLAAWARENAPEYIKSSETVLWGDLKPFLRVAGESVIYEGTGEIIDGLGVEETEETFEVK